MKLKNISANAHVVTFSNRSEVLFSYGTPVAVSINFESGRYKFGIYKTGQAFGPTTAKHINGWTKTTRTLPQREIEQLADMAGNPDLS